MNSICIFGDSTAWGAWDLEKGGWVNRLWLYVAKRGGDNYVEIYNWSICGGTTNTILERFENEARIRNADAIIFQTGGNDAAYEHLPHNYLVAPDIFRSNVGKIINGNKSVCNNRFQRFRR